MMSRIQVSMDQEAQRRAKQRASALGISFAEYVRRLVARDLEGVAHKTDPFVVFDLGDSGGSDVAREKDRMVAEAVVADRKRRRRR